MKKYVCGWAILLCLAGLASCGGKAASPQASEEEFIVTVVCKNKEVNHVGYSACIGGDRRTMGGSVELGGAWNAAEHTFEFRFSPADFQDEDDISQFSITLTPYGKGDKESGTAEPVAIAAEYGKNYTIGLSGDQETGFSAELEEAQ